MTTRLTLAALAGCAMLFASEAGAANEYSALLKARKFAEAERVANAKLVQDPVDRDALVAKNEAILGSGPASRIEEAVKLGTQCVDAHPRESNCHLALGNALGAKAMHGGIMSAIGYAGKIRDAFKTAVELDPHNLDARFSLLQYYIQAPAIVGGGTGKAQALASQTAAVNAEASRLMLAQLDIAADNLAKAEVGALAVRPQGNDMVADQQRSVLLTLGGKYLAAKKFADSERIYREVQQRFPENESGLYGIARVRQEQGRYREALAAYEQALALSPRPYIYYRIGQTVLALNDKARAVASFEKALSFHTGLSQSMQSDAEEQLKALRR